MLKVRLEGLGASDQLWVSQFSAWEVDQMALSGLFQFKRFYDLMLLCSFHSQKKATGGKAVLASTLTNALVLSDIKHGKMLNACPSLTVFYEEGETSQRTTPFIPSYGLDSVPSTTPESLCAEGRKFISAARHFFSFLALNLVPAANADLSIWRRNKCLH